MTTLAELRAKVDDVDQRIIELLAERAGYVHQIGLLKRSEQDIVAPDRQQQVYETRRHWAQAVNLDPEMVEQLYRVMIAHFIEKQREQLKNGE